MRSAKQLIAELDAEFKAAEWEAEGWSESCFINALLVIAKVPENDVIHAGDPDRLAELEVSIHGGGRPVCILVRFTRVMEDDTTETRLRGRLLAEYVDDESAKKFLKDTVSAFSQA